MHLVEVGERVVALGHVADFGDRRDVAVHRVDAFEHHQLGQRRVECRQLAVQVVGVVMGKHFDAGAAVARALDHAGVVLGVRQHHAAGKPRGQRANGGPVAHVAGVEQQRRVLAVQVGQLLFQQHVVVVGAGDVAGAAGAGAAMVQRLVHRRQHGWVLAHA